jgi:hypothetical protein
VKDPRDPWSPEVWKAKTYKGTGRVAKGASPLNTLRNKAGVPPMYNRKK